MDNIKIKKPVNINSGSCVGTVLNTHADALLVNIVHAFRNRVLYNEYRK